MTAWVPLSWMLPCALATMVIGSAGVLAARELRELAAFALLGSTAMLVTTVALFDQRALAAGLYYLPHTTLAAASLFLVVDLVIRGRDDHSDALVSGPPFAGMERLSLLYFLAAIAIAGLPPLSGFVGKLLILQATADGEWTGWIWAAILATTLLSVLGLARAGSVVFWKSTAGPQIIAGSSTARPATIVELLPLASLIVLLVALTTGAGAATGFIDRLTGQLFSPAAYIDAVLDPAGGHDVLTRKLFPHPGLSFLLALVWMLMLNSATWGGLLLGIVLAILVPIFTGPFWPDRPKLHFGWPIIEYLGIVFADIVIASFQVASLILFRRSGDLRARWLCVPLDLRSAEAITTLAGTISLTPGTVSADVSTDGRHLLVHILDTGDEAAEVARIKARYEARLQRIFQ